MIAKRFRDVLVGLAIGGVIFLMAVGSYHLLGGTA